MLLTDGVASATGAGVVFLSVTTAVAVGDGNAGAGVAAAVARAGFDLNPKMMAAIAIIRTTAIPI